MEDEEPTRAEKAGEDATGKMQKGNETEVVGEELTGMEEAGKDVTKEAQKEGDEAEVTGEDEQEEQQESIDYSILKGTKVNKAGNLVNGNGDVIGRLVEGEAKQLLGKTADESGNLWNESGKIVGRAEPLPDKRAGAKDFAPF